MPRRKDLPHTRKNKLVSVILMVIVPDLKYVTFSHISTRTIQDWAASKKNMEF